MLSVRSEPYGREQGDGIGGGYGSGISSHDWDRIFEPAVHDEVLQRHGNGLSICRAIIEAHEGRLWFAPNRPRGTVFQFTLCCDEATAVR